jgi:hypothetical protein
MKALEPIARGQSGATLPRGARCSTTREPSAKVCTRSSQFPVFFVNLPRREPATGGILDLCALGLRFRSPQLPLPFTKSERRGALLDRDFISAARRALDPPPLRSRPPDQHSDKKTLNWFYGQSSHITMKRIGNWLAVHTRVHLRCIGSGATVNGR